MDIEKELTNKFLSGQMSFAEYSSEWYEGDEEEDLDEADKRFEEEPQQSRQLSKILKKKRRYTRLSTALLGLMGEANLRFARGDVEMAERMCHEIIKQLPTAAEPYQTLAQIYENDSDKSLQFSLLAAHLGRADADEWWRLAGISKQRNDIKQAMICYTQATKAEPQNMETHLRRLEFVEYLEEIKFPLNSLNISRVKCYHKIVTSMSPHKGEIIMKYARMAASLYDTSTEVERTIEVLSAAFKKCPALFTPQDMNIYLEMLITQKQYQTCIEVFVSGVGIDIEAEIQTFKTATGEIEEQTNYINCMIPDNLAIDLKSKLLVCFIHLGAFNLVQTLLSDFLKNDVEKAGDLYMDIEEAFSAVGHHEMAIKLLEPLVRNTNFDLGAVWLKHAECLLNLGRIDDAVESYHKVLKHVPQHPDARRKLFTILESKGCINEALNILQQDPKFVVSPSLLYEQCKVLKKYNMLLKYLEVGEIFLSRHGTKLRHQEELIMASRVKGALELLHNFRTLRGESIHSEDDIQFADESFKIPVGEEWEFFLELYNIAFQNKLYPIMERLTFTAFLVKGFSTYRQHLEYYCAQSCMLNRDFKNMLKFLRDLANKYYGTRIFNLLGYVFNFSEECIQNRYITRLFQKDCNVVRLLFYGNNFFISGRYLIALKYYLEYHDHCREPISALLIAISILSLAAQKTVDKHHNLILQGISYMQTYRKLRKCDQEAYYNLGRAYQMLNINNLAIECYEKALKCGPIAQCSQHGVLDLTKEAAFNLYVIYKDHSPEIARRYILKYLVV
ncbi:general transcription factor 3C polypeptide 3 isoform X2 [Aricia agestis]|nr:general transcription factor 3C polypeptide 3 isoform X2 [Aricia agestis]